MLFGDSTFYFMQIKPERHCLDCCILHSYTKITDAMSLFVITGLAWAICEHLIEITKAPTLFATHFHELTALESNQDSSGHDSGVTSTVGVANYHVKAHLDDVSRKLTMLYKV